MQSSAQPQKDTSRRRLLLSSRMAISDEMHIRDSLISLSQRLHIPEDMAPTGREGMLSPMESVSEDGAFETSSIDGVGAGGAGEGTALLPLAGSQKSHTQQTTKEIKISVINSTLEEVDSVARKRIKDGFSEFNFTVGVVNTIAVVWVFALYPQHFWLLYLLEGFVLIPSKLRANLAAEPLSHVLFLLDYCWQMNTLALIVLAVFCIDSLVRHGGNYIVHEQLFLAAVGTACGPLLGACLVLPFVCLLFHDISTLAGFFIHMFPPMVMFTLRWNADEIREAWPSIFFLDYMDDVHFFSEGTWSPVALGSVAGNTMALYFCWFVLYSIWMLLVGINVPRSDRVGSEGRTIVPKYDTCFHNFMRAGLCILLGSACWGRTKAVSVAQMESSHFERRDYLVYIAAHAVLAIGSLFVLGWPCFTNKIAHGSFLILVALVSVYRGAQRYTYYTTSMYGKALRKQFAEYIDEIE